MPYTVTITTRIVSYPFIRGDLVLLVVVLGLLIVELLLVGAVFVFLLELF